VADGVDEAKASNTNKLAKDFSAKRISPFKSRQSNFITQDNRYSNHF
jgi:hypothetical protein